MENLYYIRFSRERNWTQLNCVCRTSSERRRYTEVVIWAFKNNLNAISFYRKHGYILEKEEYLGKPYLTMGVRLNKKI